MADRWVSAVEVRRETGDKVEWKDLQEKADANGHTIHAAVYTNYSFHRTAPIIEAWREDQQGNRVNDETLYIMLDPIDGFDPRADSLGVKIAGGNVHFRISAHGATPEGGGARDGWLFEHVEQGWYAPHPSAPHSEPEGAETYIPTGNGGGSSEPVDYDEVERRAQFVVDSTVPYIVYDMVEQLFNGGEGSRKVFEQLINCGFSANMVSAYMLGQWDGLLPNGQPWPHPLTGRPITDDTPWVTPR